MLPRYLLPLLPLACSAQDAALDREAMKILDERCVFCHGSSSGASKLSLTSREGLLRGGARSGPAVIPGNPDKSPLIRYLTGEEKPQMPLRSAPLPDDEIALFKRWIAEMPAPKEGAAAVAKDSSVVIM